MPCTACHSGWTSLAGDAHEEHAPQPSPLSQVTVGQTVVQVDDESSKENPRAAMGDSATVWGLWRMHLGQPNPAQRHVKSLVGAERGKTRGSTPERLLSVVLEEVVARYIISCCRHNRPCRRISRSSRFDPRCLGMSVSWTSGRFSCLRTFLMGGRRGQGVTTYRMPPSGDESSTRLPTCDVNQRPSLVCVFTLLHPKSSIP